MNTQNQLITNEFTFRYCYPLTAEKTFRPLSEMELKSQFADYCYQQPQDISELAAAAVRGDACPQPDSGDVQSKLLYALARTHIPNYVTTDSPYGFHADYPSPRSYYPLQFILHRIVHGQSRFFHVDLENWQLRQVEQQADVSETLHVSDQPLADNTLILKTNFNIYNELYNRFRYGLFCLESGHFHKALNFNLQELGLSASLKWRNGVLSLALQENSELRHPCPAVSTAESHPLSRRTSGFFHYGLFPKKCQQTEQDFQEVARVFQQHYRHYAELHPGIEKFSISLKAVVDNHSQCPGGIYGVTSDGLQLLQEGQFMDKVEDAYNYNNFSFLHTSVVFFFVVDKTSIDCDQHAVSCNIALGYLSQSMIEHFTGKGLFARPFRSYDQFKLDQLINHQLQDEQSMTYYGLLVGKNRAVQPIGALK